MNPFDSQKLVEKASHWQNSRVLAQLYITLEKLGLAKHKSHFHYWKKYRAKV